MSKLSGRKKTARRWLFVLILAVVVIAGSFVFHVNNRQRRLLTRAHEVARPSDLSGLVLRSLNEGLPSIATLNDDDWMVGEPTMDKALQLRYSIKRFNTTSHASVPQALLSSIINENGVIVGDMEPSPDGHWIAGTLLRGAFSLKPEWRFAIRVTGGGFKKWPATVPERRYEPSFERITGSFTAWMPDNRAVAEVVVDTEDRGNLRLHGTSFNVLTGEQSRFDVTGPILSGIRPQLAIRPGTLILSSFSNYHQEWTWPSDRFSRVNFEYIDKKLPLKQSFVDLYSWSLNLAKSVPLMRHLECPSGTWLVGLAVAPDGKHIAWEVVRETHPIAITQFLSRLLERQDTKAYNAVEVWISGIDGTNFDEVGFLPFSGEWAPEMRLRLGWLPSGKKLRFVHKGSVFTVDAHP